MKKVILACLVACLIVSQAQAEVVVYTEDFENWEVSPNWHLTNSQAKPAVFSTWNQQRFLGLLTEDKSVIFTLSNLKPDFEKISVNFDLYLIGGWGDCTQGNSIWSYKVNNEPVINAKFTNLTHPRLCEPLSAIPLGTTCQIASTDSLGLWYGNRVTDSIYHIESVISCSDTNLSLTFGSSQGSDNPCLRSWGIDNLTITTSVSTGSSLVYTPVDEPAGVTAICLGIAIFGYGCLKRTHLY